MSANLKLVKPDLTPERQLELIKLARREFASLAELVFALECKLAKVQKRLADLEAENSGLRERIAEMEAAELETAVAD